LDIDNRVEIKPKLMLLQRKSKKRTKREVKLTFVNILKLKPAPEPADKAKLA
jgi:hypothetical protein